MNFSILLKPPKCQKLANYASDEKVFYHHPFFCYVMAFSVDYFGRPERMLRDSQQPERKYIFVKVLKLALRQRSTAHTRIPTVENKNSFRSTKEKESCWHCVKIIINFEVRMNFFPSSTSKFCKCLQTFLPFASSVQTQFR